jgi:hypothetical protein
MAALYPFNERNTFAPTKKYFSLLLSVKPTIYPDRQICHAQQIIIIIIIILIKTHSDITLKISSVITKHVLPSGGVLLTNSDCHMVFMSIMPICDVKKIRFVI